MKYDGWEENFVWFCVIDCEVVVLCVDFEIFRVCYEVGFWVWKGGCFLFVFNFVYIEDGKVVGLVFLGVILFLVYLGECFVGVMMLFEFYEVVFGMMIFFGEILVFF